MTQNWRTDAQIAGSLAAIGLTSALVFSRIGQPWAQPVYLVPILACMAIRFSWRWVTLGVAIMMVVAAFGINPYTARIADPQTARLILQQVMLISAASAMTLSFLASYQRRTAARLSDLMETVDLGIFMTRELDGTILFWSKGAERLYGWTAADAVGQVSHTLLKTEHPVPVAEIEAAVINDGEWRGDLRHTTRDGAHLIVAVHKVRRQQRNGDILVLLEAITDVTVQRTAQAALADLNHELEARVEAEIAAREETKKRVKSVHHMQALGKIAAGVAHEFNNILQVIVGGITVIAERPDDTARVARFSGIVLSAADRGSLITSRLLAFSGRALFHIERIEPALVLDALRDVLAATLGGKVAVRLNLEPRLPAMVIDKSEFETALINLATNARDAMPDGGAITITTDTQMDPEGLTPGQYLRVSVHDDGVGMDDATARRSVEPFFTTKGIGKGTGLGLSMVKGFTEQSGGGLAIESTPGVGTTVTLWLPVVASDEPPVAQRPVPRAVADGKPVPRVLLVDDEDLVRETVAFGLEEHGHSVLMASSGAAALALLDAGVPVDVLVSDYAMPTMDGLSLIREARARRPGLPALVLTGYVESVGTAEIDTGLTSVLSVLRKPITARELSSSIQAALTLAKNGSAS